MDSFNTPFSRMYTDSKKWDLPRINLGHEDFLSFSTADSDYPTAQEIIDALVNRAKHGAFGYTYASKDYFNTICSWVKRHYHYEIEPSWIVKSPTVLTSLYLAIENLTDEDAKIVVQPPVYNPFYSVIESSGRQLVFNPLIKDHCRYTIDFPQLEELFKAGAKMLVFCSPHNPIGRVWTYEEVKRIVVLCKQYQVLLFSDEIHCDMIFGKEFVSAGLFFRDYENIAVATAPTKTFNLAGLQISNLFIANSTYRQKIEVALRKLNIADSNIMGLVALKAAYEKSELWLKNQLSHLQNNLSFAKTFFETEIPDAQLGTPEGTYLLWVDLRFLKMGSKAIVSHLESYGVIVNPGDMYGSDYDGFIRINVACSIDQLKTGLKRLKKFIDDEMKK